MKLHYNLVVASLQTLDQIFFQGKYADKAIEKTLQSNKKWGARDRAFIAESTYEIVRGWRLLNELHALAFPKTKVDLWNIFALWLTVRKEPFPAWEEFKGFNQKAFLEPLSELLKTRKIRESIPDWMDDLCSRELGEAWDRELTALNQQADVVLRVNTLKTNKAALQKVLASEGIEVKTLAGYDDALVLTKRQSVFRSEAFKNGLFEVQDGGSQLIAPMLDVKPGMRVIDACAGGGGKTLHLASLMENQGRIISMDIEEWKLNNLKVRARRAGANNVESRVIESTKTIKRLAETADRVLLDVPCSGLGVLKRNPDAKWKLSADFIDEIRKTQAEILESYSKMVKPGGKLVYSTCSILHSENDEQVKKFLAKHEGEFELEEEKQLYPSETGFDGFYMARMKRVK